MSPTSLGGIVAIAVNASVGEPIRRRVSCLCGYRVEGSGDALLCRQIRTHVDRVHPELPYTEHQIRDWVGSGAVYLLSSGLWPAARMEGGDQEERSPQKAPSRMDERTTREEERT